MLILTRELTIASLQRVAASRIPLFLWVLYIAAGLSPVALAYLETASGGNENSLSRIAIFAVVGLLVVLLLIYSEWRITRALADNCQRTGDFWAWIGWGILAYAPAIIVETALSQTSGSWRHGEPLAYSTALACAVPLLVHSDGRAIDGFGPSIWRVFDFWSPQYLSLVTAFFLLVLPGFYVGHIMLVATEDNHLLFWFGETSAAIAYSVSILLGTALAVEAFDRIREV